MKTTRPIYVTTMGPIGSGKSTTANLLAERLDLHVSEENFGDNPFLARFYRDMKRWAFQSQSFFLLEKIAQMFSAAHKMKDGVSIIQDTPIQQDVYSYAKAQYIMGNLDDEEWRLYQKIYLSFIQYYPKNDLIIYLKAPMSVVQKRIKMRGRDYEVAVQIAYHELLESLNQQWVADNKDIPILEINSEDYDIHKDVDVDKLAKVVEEKLKELGLVSSHSHAHSHS